MFGTVLLTIGLLTSGAAPKAKARPKPPIQAPEPSPQIPKEAPATVSGVDAPGSHLNKARELSGQFEFAAALQELTFAMAQSPTPAEKAEILTMRAFAHSALEDVQQAAEAFADLLVLQPTYVLPRASSPKVRQAFTDAQRVVELRQAVVLSASPIVMTEGSPTTLDVKVESGAARVAELTLHYRLADTTEGFQQAAFSAANRNLYSVRLPQTFKGPARTANLSYFVRARDVAGAVVAQLGSDVAPLSIETRTLEAAAPPITSSWVFWTAIGVVAVGAAASPFIVIAATPTPVPNGSLGQVTLR
jgi:hypothetical protein